MVLESQITHFFLLQWKIIMAVRNQFFPIYFFNSELCARKFLFLVIIIAMKTMKKFDPD